MKNADLKQRANLLFEDAGKRLQDIKKLNLDKTESEAQTEWLELRRYEIQHILGLVADPDEEIHDEELKRLVEENQPIALKRILELENDP